MEASKIKFTPGTAESLNNPLLTKQKKGELRRQIVLDYIRGLPAGSYLNTEEIRIACHLPANHSGRSMVALILHNLDRKKLINLEHTKNSRKWIASIPGDAKTIVPPTKKVEPEPKESITAPPPRYKSEYRSNFMGSFARQRFCLAA